MRIILIAFPAAAGRDADAAPRGGCRFNVLIGIDLVLVLAGALLAGTGLVDRRNP